MADLTIQADGVATSPGTTKEYTRTTMATQLLGELGVLARDSNETAPDRLINIILASFGYCHDCYDWQFRERIASLAVTADATEYEITTNYADFAKTQVNDLEELTGKGTLRLTTRVMEYERARMAYLNSSGTLDSGTPAIGRIIPDTTASGYGVKLVFAPKADGSYSYRMPYLCKAPSLGTTDTPSWPDFMFELWHLHAKCEAQKAFGDGEEWKDTYRHFLAIKAAAIAENDEEHTLSTGVASSNPYGDPGLHGLEPGFGEGLLVCRD